MKRAQRSGTERVSASQVASWIGIGPTCLTALASAAFVGCGITLLPRYYLVHVIPFEGGTGRNA